MIKGFLLSIFFLICASGFGQLITTNMIKANELPRSVDFIPVIFSWGQSNEIGRAEYGRYLDLSPYSFDPSRVYVYYKPDYTATDNGSWQSIQVGSGHTHEYDLASFLTYGSYVTAAIKLSAVLDKNVYIIPTADGGTVVNTLGTYRTWNPATSSESFDVALDNYYQVAIDKLQTAFPGKRIVVFPMVTEGETDAFQSRTQLQFYNDVTTIVDAMRAYEQLEVAPIFVSKINYLQTAGETTINNAWIDYYNATKNRTRLIETSDLKRKTDLTLTEKGGISASTGSDDEHLSYLAQNTKGLRLADAVSKFYQWTDVSITPSSSNTTFDPSTIGTVHVRIQGTSGKVSLVANKYNISTITNDGSIGSFSITNGTYQYKENEVKGWINADKETYSGGILAQTPRIQTSVAVGTSLFNHSFSFAAWVKPRDGQPPIAYTFFHDIQNTASINNSRVYAGITTGGKLYAYYAVGGTVVQAQTANAIFVDGTQEESKHVAYTFTSGDYIRIYVDGVLQTLDVSLNGNIAAITMANYVNATNLFTVGANRSGASTYNNHFFGHIREFIIQPVVYSTTDIANLMLN